MLVIVLYSSVSVAEYRVPDKYTPVYNILFKKCVISSDEIMLQFHDVFTQVDEEKAKASIRVVYSEQSHQVQNLFEEMVGTLYNSDLELSDKLDEYFFKCLDTVNEVLGV